MGGGFGAKINVYREQILVVALALAAPHLFTGIAARHLLVRDGLRHGSDADEQEQRSSKPEAEGRIHPRLPIL